MDDDDNISPELMNTIISNMQFLFDNSTEISYSAYSTTQSEGMKIACGAVKIPASSATASGATVLFGNYFTPGIRPIVVASIAQDTGFRTIMKIEGLDATGSSSGRSFPSAEGFKITAKNTAAVAFSVPDCWVNWIAIGF